MSLWPAALRLKTRKLLDGVDPFPAEGILRMKNINNFTAYLKKSDLKNGQIILYDMETQLATCFPTAGEMFEAGWIADLPLNSHFRLLTNTESPDTAEIPTTRAATIEADRVVPFTICKAKERG